MTRTTRDSSWRLLVGAAPLGGVVALAWAIARGGQIARSTAAPGLLALLAALGAAVAWWTARQWRGAPAPMPSVSVSDANAQAAAGRLEGIVALQGRRHALPDATPLVSPDGELCLWYRHGETTRPHGATSASARPSQPFTIRVGTPGGHGAMYGLLAIVDALVLRVAGGLACSASFGARRARPAARWRPGSR